MADEQSRPSVPPDQVMPTTEALKTAAHRDDRYRMLVEAIVHYAVYMLDPQGNVVSWNRGAQRFKGYAADEIIGQYFWACRKCAAFTSH